KYAALRSVRERETVLGRVAKVIEAFCPRSSRLNKIDGERVRCVFQARCSLQRSVIGAWPGRNESYHRSVVRSSLNSRARYFGYFVFGQRGIRIGISSN